MNSRHTEEEEWTSVLGNSREQNKHSIWVNVLPHLNGVEGGERYERPEKSDGLSVFYS